MSSVTFKLPSQLLALAEGRRSIPVQAATLGQALRQLDEAAPMVRSQLFTRTGAIRQFVGLFLDGQQLIELGDGAQPLREGSQVVIVMAVAGG
jgi:hypothetical protein